MSVSNRLSYGAFLAALLMLCVSGCVVKDREVVHHDASGYEQGYKEGYYDRDHHRWWHENAWHDCIEHDVHCPPP